jgi:hypothetical protein
MDADDRYQRIRTRWGALKNERSSWDSHWKEIADVLLPRSSRFMTSDTNRGNKKHARILDNSGTRALRVLAAGMMSGMTSPARPWFRLTTSIPELDESDDVKRWLSDVTRQMQMVFAKSNTYRALHTCYEEMAAFGTNAVIVMPDFEEFIRLYPMTAGEYCIATDYRGEVQTLYREFAMTVGQIVGEFGKENCSTATQNMYERGTLDSWVTVLHAIEPRPMEERTPHGGKEHGGGRRRDNRAMPWRSVYLEVGGEQNKALRETGFEQFPALCPRWLVVGGDIYGQSPAMEALGDLKQLQHEQKRKAQGIDYQTLPPLQGPATLKTPAGMPNILPGGFTFTDAMQQNGIRPMFETNLNLQYLLLDIQDVRQRIDRAFYADLFLMLANSENPQMTATEVAERHEEKLLMLGPVLERMHNEILDPLIDHAFVRLVETGRLPPPPDSLQGMPLNVEFVSMLAQAQRAIGTNSIDRYVGRLGMVAQMKPDVLDKFDSDSFADIYADALGIDPKLVVPGEQVALIRQQRAEAQQAAQQAAQMQQMADSAAKLGGIDTSKPNAATDVMRMFTGYT